LQQLVDVQALKVNNYNKSWIDRLGLAEFLHAWLVSHIVDEDKKIGVFVRGRKAGWPSDHQAVLVHYPFRVFFRIPTG
jgi:hemerythrin